MMKMAFERETDSHILLLGVDIHKTTYKVLTIMRGYQVPVSAVRWQHGSRICFAAFIK
jgi:hypothetical protein